jgi:DNA-binding transcriptional regulator YiaG
MSPSDLQAARQALNLSQVKLGEILGVSGNTVARWERGELAIQHPKMLALALKALEPRK